MNRFTHSLAGIAVILALSGLALGQSAISRSAPSNAAAPDPIDATTNTIISGSSAWSISSTQDGRTFKLDGKDGAITAEVDGKPVPADRIVVEGDNVRIKDEKGETLFVTQAPISGASGQIFSLASPRGSIFGTPRARGAGNPFAGNHMFRVDAAAVPPVMIGVQLLEPDASIRGHLGLKDNETTMISAVYEGLPAANAGLEPYDIIVAVDGKSPAAPAAVRKALHDLAAGKSVSLKVIHRGQEKTVSVTPEKYDHERLDKAKINAIAASTGTPSATTLSLGGDPDMEVFMNRALGGTNGQTFIGTTPGKPITIWAPSAIGGAGSQSMDDFAKRMQEMAEKMQAQAEAARLDAERLHQQLLSRPGALPVPGAFAPGMDDRMKQMEDQLRKLMEEKDKKKTEEKDTGRS
jgi:hypothetical protein